MPAFGPIAYAPTADVPAVATVVPCTGAASRMMNARVSVYRRTEAKSATTGGLVPTYVEHIASVCASLQVDSASESMVDMRESGELRLRLYTPSGADIQTTDRIVPLTGIYAGLTFAVESGQADDAGYGAYGKWRIRRVEGGGVR